jgi:hypothetical protein
MEDAVTEEKLHELVNNEIYACLAEINNEKDNLKL